MPIAKVNARTKNAQKQWEQAQNELTRENILKVKDLMAKAGCSYKDMPGMSKDFADTFIHSSPPNPTRFEQAIKEYSERAANQPKEKAPERKLQAEVA